jgi:putative flippase GtrA
MLRKLPQMFRSAAAGGLGSLCEFALLIPLVELWALPYGIAAALAAGAAAMVAFAGNKWWAFADSRPTDRAQIAGFAVVAVGSMAINGVAVHVLAAELGLPYLIAKCVATLIVFATWTYPVQSRLVFRQGAISS